MNLRQAEQIVAEQQEELEALKKRKVCARPEEMLVDLSSELAQVVIGVRRSGKSTLCLNKLFRQNEPFGYLNFDDERLESVTNEDLDVLLTALYRFYGAIDILFFDEIQNVEAWPLFINRLLRLGKRVLLTGSNAKLLSSELATHMTGRAHQIVLLPFSFQDVCTYHSVSPRTQTAQSHGLVRKVFEDYLHDGGFPQVVKGYEDGRTLIGELTDNILERDICQRYAIRNTAPFRALAHHLLNVAPTTLNYKALSQKFEGALVSNTIKRYVAYLKQAYLLIGIQKYATKSHLRIRNEKVYPVDVSFMNQRANTLAGENLGWRLETCVLLELIRRTSQTRDDIYYYQEDRSEIDFVVCHGNDVRAAIQVAYDISSPRTRQRELRALESFSHKHPQAEFLLLTDCTAEDVELSTGATVRIRPVYEWLLERPDKGGHWEVGEG